MKTKILISLFILNFLSACKFADMSNIKPKDDFTYTNVTFRIKGTITDSTNNSPVIGADLTLFNGPGFIGGAITNNEGHYTIDCTYAWRTPPWPVGEDHLDLQIIATGYKTKYIYCTDKDHVRITDEWQIIDGQLEPGSSNHSFYR